MAWEADWAHAGNTGQRVWARNPTGHSRSSREWHWTLTAYLRQHGVTTPTYRKDSWEVDWTRRNGKEVWARNPASKMPSAQDWHWVDFHTLERAGLAWHPKTAHTGRYIDSRGYMLLTRRAMTDAEIQLAEQHNLFRGTRKTFVREHHLAAVQKFGRIPPNTVVRHLNGIKTDNRADNLLLGTTQENTMDHNQARLSAMYWHNQYEAAHAEIARLQSLLGRHEGPQ